MDVTKQNNAATILVVDDNKNNLDLMLATLSEHNYRLLAATSGERALKIATKRIPDLIIMDIQMPVMDGFETTRQLKKNPLFANIPVLFLSALSDVKTIIKCFDAGGVDYISKPFQKEELFARIKTHLAIKNLQTQLRNERDKTNAILKNILPENLIHQLKHGEKPEPQRIENTGVIFTDFENFTGLSKKLGPADSVMALNEIFFGFDEIMHAFGLERVKTIGDAYMAIGGVNTGTEDTLLRTTLAALKLQDFITLFNKKNKTRDDWKLRVGVHYGPIIAGIIGYQKIAFDVWGDTVNLASRLESVARTTGITISEQVYDGLKDTLILKTGEERKLHNWGNVKIYHCSGFNADNEKASELYNAIDIRKVLKTELGENSLLKKIFELE